MGNITIRREKPKDYDEVYQLVKTSFAASEHCDGDEQDYLNEIRKTDRFIPQLSLVAENDKGKIIGQIILHRTYIISLRKSHPELVLGPICVHPDYFRRGIARSLLNEALLIARKMGYGAVFLCGVYDIYIKLGFKPTYLYNIFHVRDDTKEAEWCMVRELYDGALDGVEGIIDIL